jgi:hypothetical protein
MRVCVGDGLGGSGMSVYLGVWFHDVIWAAFMVWVCWLIVGKWWIGGRWTMLCCLGYGEWLNICIYIDKKSLNV